MIDFETLVKDSASTTKEPKEYLEEFFVRQNFRTYLCPEDLDKEEYKAVKTMFESRKELYKRARDVLDVDPFCLEAFFTYFLLTEDIYVYHSFREYFAHAEEYAELTPSQKRRYLRILDFFVEFLLDIRNITEAIKIQRMIMRLGNDESPYMVNRLSYMYMMTENDEEFYRHYLSYDFDEYDYLLLLVTLLKHEDEFRAREVLNDMLGKIEYADYLDHLWDLDLNDPEQKEFYQTVTGCQLQTDSVFDFFGWVNRNKPRA